MEDIGFILPTYLLTFGAAAMLAWRVLRAGRSLARRLPDDEKPWT